MSCCRLQHYIYYPPAIRHHLQSVTASPLVSHLIPPANTPRSASSRLTLAHIDHRAHIAQHGDLPDFPSVSNTARRAQSRRSTRMSTRIPRTASRLHRQSSTPAVGSLKTRMRRGPKRTRAITTLDDIQNEDDSIHDDDALRPLRFPCLVPRVLAPAAALGILSLSVGPAPNNPCVMNQPRHRGLSTLSNASRANGLRGLYVIRASANGEYCSTHDDEQSAMHRRRCGIDCSGVTW